MAWNGPAALPLLRTGLKKQELAFKKKPTI
jgi:hypothetical protein